MELKDRLKIARKEKKLTQIDVATSVGITQASYSELERGLVKSSGKIVEIAQALNVNPQWLATGQGEMTANTAHVSISGNNAGIIGGANNTQNNYGDLHQTVVPSDFNPTHLKDIPLLDIDMGVLFALNQSNTAIHDDERVATFIPHSSRTFGIKNNSDIIGISPSTIRKDDILIVEPCIVPRDNDLVLLCVNYDRENRGVIARLSLDLAGNRMVKYNGNLPEPMPIGSLICGVVIEIKRRLIDTMSIQSRLNIGWDITQTLVVE